MASSRWRERQTRNQARDCLPLDELVGRRLKSRGHSAWLRLQLVDDAVHLDVAAADRSVYERLLSTDEDLADKVVLNGQQLRFEVLG